MYHESLVQTQCLSFVLLGVVLCVIYVVCGNLSVSKQDGWQGPGRVSPGSPVWPSGFLAWANQKPSRSLTWHVLDVREASVAHCHPHGGIRSRESSSHRTKGKWWDPPSDDVGTFIGTCHQQFLELLGISRCLWFISYVKIELGTWFETGYVAQIEVVIFPSLLPRVLRLATPLAETGKFFKIPR